eukprot:m.291875 g.291875  ORF g.291875 m.291875 type:complete len:220 (+) comp40729_c2_seq11:2410-3069(+)
MTLKDLPPNATVNFTFYGVARDFASYRSPQATIFDGVALWCENEGKVSTYLSVPSLTVVKVSLLGRVELGHCFLPVASLCPGYQHIYLQGKDRATIFSLFVCVKTKEGIDDAERKRLKQNKISYSVSLYLLKVVLPDGNRVVVVAQEDSTAREVIENLASQEELELESDDYVLSEEIEGIVAAILSSCCHVTSLLSPMLFSCISLLSLCRAVAYIKQPR